MQRHRSLGLPLVAAVCLAALALTFVPHTAHAKLDHKDWKQLQSDYLLYFGQRGSPFDKSAVMKRLVQDGERRSRKLIASGFALECRLVWELQKQLQDTTAEHIKAMKTRFHGGGKEDEQLMQDLQKDLATYELELKVERNALNAVLKIIAEAPEAVRSELMKKAKSNKEWTYRTAVALLAVHNIAEGSSKNYLQRMFIGEKDPRVRGSVLSAIGEVEDGWQDYAIGRLGDPDWGVRLLAVNLVHYRGLKRAVPHLINGLAGATPRVADAIGTALEEFTGQKIDPSGDAWSRWWADNKAGFNPDIKVKKGAKGEKFKIVHFYGMPIKSDRVLFIIDVSHSMKEVTQNHNPADKWKAPPVTTGGDAPPPPPPPPEILSGPKIKVAKHELKKALLQLPPDTTFNIIAFSNAAVSWQPKMVKADKAHKDAALKWVRALKARSVTYIDGALRLAFKIGGMVDVGQSYPEITIDTIVVLSDGAPTDNSNKNPKLMDTEIILKHVQEWNKDKRVKIHCIGVDIQPHIVFLKQLADLNGGTYIDR